MLTVTNLSAGIINTARAVVCSLSVWLFNSIDPVVVVVLMMVVEGEQGEAKGVKLINKSVDQQLNSSAGCQDPP